MKWLENQQQTFSKAWRKASLSTSGTTLLIMSVYLILTVGLTILMANPLLFPAIGLIGAVAINLVVFFFLRSELTLPLYLIVAGPSVALSLNSAGILSRLYLGNLLFFLVVIIWIILKLLPNRKTGRWLLKPNLLFPLLSLNLVGIISIIAAHLFPDPYVVYSFQHSNTPLIIVNAAEMMLLAGLPMFLVIVPGIVSTVRHVYWFLSAYMIVGLMYALGAIFAAPLGLYSKQVILGVRRPEIFGSVSSGLGTLITLFACIAFCQALYQTKALLRATWILLTIIMCLGVVMTFGRESWLALFLAFMTIGIVYSKSWKILGAVLILLIPLILFSGVTNFFDPDQTYGADRLKIWLDAFNIWYNHALIMGTGAGNYQFFNITYGTDVVGVAHNQYLQVLAEMGLQGLACLIWALIAVGRTCRDSFSNATSRLGKSIALAYLGYFAAIIFGGFFTSSFVPSAADGGGTASFVGVSYRWLLLGLVLSIPNWEKEALAAEQNRPSTSRRTRQQGEQEVVSTS